MKRKYPLKLYERKGFSLILWNKHISMIIYKMIHEWYICCQLPRKLKFSQKAQVSFKGSNQVLIIQVSSDNITNLNVPDLESKDKVFPMSTISASI